MRLGELTPGAELDAEKDGELTNCGTCRGTAGKER